MTPSFNYIRIVMTMTLRQKNTQLPIIFWVVFLTFQAAWLQGAPSSVIVRDSVETFFRLNDAVLDTAYFHNGERLDTCFSALAGNPGLDITGVNVVGAASPEGGESLNHRLSNARARNLLNYIFRTIMLPDSPVSVTPTGRDWTNMLRLVAADTDFPQRKEVLAIIDSYGERLADNPDAEDECMHRIMQIDGGKAYRYLRGNIFPLLRKATIVVEYDRPYIRHISPLEAGNPHLYVNLAPTPADIVHLQYPSPAPHHPLYMALKTNMLYDLAAVPNATLEYYVGKGWSLTGGGMYAWWSNDSRHRYWRIYGGKIGVRKWFGKAASLKPLTGHHVGLYAGVLTFDFEWGKSGYMGGIPHGTLLDRCMLTGGVEYGYSLPVARRLNIDFTLGVGYFGGKYIKYDPVNGKYFEDSEVRLNYFGPTKLEISLVWLFGHGNFNKSK